MPATSKNNALVLDELFRVIESRRDEDPGQSYTAKLLLDGTPTIARKVGEESVEAIIEALRLDKIKLAEESADLLYHLLVLWADQGIAPIVVWDILFTRFGISGVEEKKSRMER